MRFFKSHGFGKPPLREMLFRVGVSCFVLGPVEAPDMKSTQSVKPRVDVMVALERPYRRRSRRTFAGLERSDGTTGESDLVETRRVGLVVLGKQETTRN